MEDDTPSGNPGNAFRRRFLACAGSVALLPAFAGCATASPRPERIALVVALDRTLLRLTCTSANRAGQVDELATLDAAIQYAAWHPVRPLLYVVTSDADTPGRRGPARHALTTVRMTRTGAEIAGTPLPLPGAANHIAAHPDGTLLFLACHAPSMLLAIALDGEDMPGATIAQFGEDRVGPFAHQAAVAPSGDAVIVSARGNDARDGQEEERGALTTFDLRHGRLSRAGMITMPPGLGPRNLDFHPSQPWAYVAMERGNRLVAMRWHGSGFDPMPRFIVGTLAEPARLRPRQRAGAVRMHPGGKHVYVANRADRISREADRRTFAGGENNIAVFAIDPGSGAPAVVQHIDSAGIEPRSMAINADGTLLAVGNQVAFEGTAEGASQAMAAGVTLFSIGADGRLTQLHRHDLAGDGLRWLDFDRA